jgi:hypothetical protein
MEIGSYRRATGFFKALYESQIPGRFPEPLSRRICKGLAKVELKSLRQYVSVFATAIR